MISVGIDPGLNGGIVARDTVNDRMRAWRVPTLEVGKGRKVRDRLDERAMWKLAGVIASMGPTIIALEGVGGLPRQSAHNAFVFGDLCGAIRMALVGHGLVVHRPAAATWKGHFRLKGGKDNKGAAIRLATELFPTHSHLWRRATDDGIAEAALLAHYAATALHPSVSC